MRKYTWRDYWKAHGSSSRLRTKLPNMWYYVKCAIWHRYTTITPRNIAPTWTDRRELLLHTSFEILMDFVEKEQKGRWTVSDLEAEIASPTDEMSKGWCLSYLATATEIEFLYHWWTVLRPERETEYDRRLTAWSDLHQADRDAYTVEHPDWQKTENPEYDDAIRDKEDDDMLHRLVNVRQSLWT